MKNLFKSVIFTLFVATFIVSCGKKSDPEPAPLTNTQKLTGKNWKITGFTVNPGVPMNGTVVTDYFAQMQSCDKDNFMTFNANGAVVSDEGNTKCSSNDPQTNTGTWSWANNEAKLTVTYPGNSPETYDVLLNDGNTLKMSQTLTINGINYVGTLTFSK
jgi:hypothetical protein